MLSFCFFKNNGKKSLYIMKNLYFLQILKSKLTLKSLTLTHKITCDLGSDTQGTILLWMESGGFKECKITALSPRSLSFKVWKSMINYSIFGDSELKGKSNWGNEEQLKLLTFQWFEFLWQLPNNPNYPFDFTLIFSLFLTYLKSYKRNWAQIKKCFTVVSWICFSSPTAITSFNQKQNKK